MRTRLFNIWYSLNSSLWFVPAIMVFLAGGAAFFTMWVDRRVASGSAISNYVLYTGSAEGAREVLSIVAGSMITVAGVVFSITMVVLAQTSTQFGPRLLKTFMRDTGNQFVLGTFLATFIYCILVLRGVRSEQGQEFVPSVSVALAFVLAVASLGVLIYFIHHVSESIQAPNIIAVVNSDLDSAIQRMFPGNIGHDRREVGNSAEHPDLNGEDVAPIVSAQNGYIRTMDGEGLLDLAIRHDVVLQLLYRPGQFLIRGEELATVRPADRLNERLARAVNDAITVGRYRTLEQDIEFAIDQMVEIAMRALSPGINDPFTAMNCVDRLGQALARLDETGMPSPDRYDRSGHLRVLAATATLNGVTDAALNQIRQQSRGNVAVTLRLLEVIAAVAQGASPEMRAALLRHTGMVYRGGDCVPEDLDRQAIRERYEAAMRILTQGTGNGALHDAIIGARQSLE